jgi:hypothetical protein
MSLIPHHKPSEVAEPRESSFDRPSAPVSSELSSIGVLGFHPVAAVGGDEFDVAGCEPASEGIAVCGSVVDDPLGQTKRSARFLQHDSIEHLLDQRRFVRRGRVEVDSQRKTFAIDHHHPLRTLAPLGFPDEGAPFFAGAKEPSAKVSSHLIRPLASSSLIKVRQILSQVPLSSQSRSRRQQVEGLGKHSGRSFHRAPLRKTQRIPSRQRRSSALGRPPKGLFGCGGSSGLIFLHWRSESNVSLRAMARTSTTPKDHYRQEHPLESQSVS